MEAATSFPRQLALSLPHAERLSREDFLEGECNASAFALVECWPAWPSPVAMLAGPEGSGKSHLGAIWATIAGARTIAARALTVASVPEALVTGAAVVEDLSPGHFDERALFHLMNLARQDGAFLLLTARSAPSTWAIGLRDLASRLRAVAVTNLSAPDDALLRALIVKLALDRQIVLDERVVGFLAGRIERSYRGVREAVARLDEESLRQHRPVTRPLAADVLRGVP